MVPSKLNIECEHLCNSYIDATGSFQYIVHTIFVHMYLMFQIVKVRLAPSSRKAVEQVTEVSSIMQDGEFSIKILYIRE
jgi:hypothetical protein